MGNAFLAEKKLSFIMKLFHFVCEKRLLNWLQVLLVSLIINNFPFTNITSFAGICWRIVCFSPGLISWEHIQQIIILAGERALQKLEENTANKKNLIYIYIYIYILENIYWKVPKVEHIFFLYYIVLGLNKRYCTRCIYIHESIKQRASYYRKKRLWFFFVAIISNIQYNHK
jgi:hypothetical protein